MNTDSFYSEYLVKAVDTDSFYSEYLVKTVDTDYFLAINYPYIVDLERNISSVSQGVCTVYSAVRQQKEKLKARRPDRNSKHTSPTKDDLLTEWTVVSCVPCAAAHKVY